MAPNQREITMEPREIVRRCIAFDDPPRIGLHFHVSPITTPSGPRVWPVTDFASAAYGPDPAFQPGPDGRNEWGVKMHSPDPTGENMGESLDPPLGEGWHRLESYRFPDYHAPGRYAGIAEATAAGHAQGKYVYGHVPSLMLLPINLRGMGNWLLDHALYQSELAYLLERVLEARLAAIEQYAAAGVDGVISYDDMGTDERGFMRPRVFRQLYFEPYRRTIDALHENGMHFLHHCCGQVREYMDMFVEAGLDVLQLDQPELMGIEWLGEQYGGKLCFWNCVDIQKTLPTNDASLIQDEAHRQVWHLGRHGGGFMVKAYQQPNAIGITAEASQAQYEGFMRVAQYPLIPHPEPKEG